MSPWDTSETILSHDHFKTTLIKVYMSLHIASRSFKLNVPRRHLTNCGRKSRSNDDPNTYLSNNLHNCFSTTRWTLLKQQEYTNCDFDEHPSVVARTTSPKTCHCYDWIWSNYNTRITKQFLFTAGSIIGAKARGPEWYKHDVQYCHGQNTEWSYKSKGTHRKL